MLLGNRKLMDDKGIDITLQEESDRLAGRENANVRCCRRQAGRS